MQRLAFLFTPCELEVIRMLFRPRRNVHDLRLHEDMLGDSDISVSHVCSEEQGSQRTITAGNSLLVECVTFEVRRRIEPMGTGRSNQMPSRDRNRR